MEMNDVGDMVKHWANKEVLKELKEIQQLVQANPDISMVSLILDKKIKDRNCRY